MLFVYFPISGRGEVSRLIAKVGGVEDFEESEKLPEGITPAMCGSTGSVPMLVDGDLKMNESVAIELYIASVAPNFADLTPQQRAKDAQFLCLKDSFLSAVAKPLFGGKDAEGITAACDKCLPAIEAILPDEGFVNGLESPTPADLCVLVMCEGYMPFGAAYKHGGVDLAAKFKKLVAHAERTKAAESVAKHFAESKTIGGLAFGF